MCGLDHIDVVIVQHFAFPLHSNIRYRCQFVSRKIPKVVEQISANLVYSFVGQMEPISNLEAKMRSFLTESQMYAELLAESGNELPGVLAPFELEETEPSEADTVLALQFVYVQSGQIAA